jgi:hypothetical protein
MYIKSISYIGENRKNDRKLKIKLSNGSTIQAAKCYESWEQWGGTIDELRLTMPIVDSHNEWLHGGQLPNQF